MDLAQRIETAIGDGAARVSGELMVAVAAQDPLLTEVACDLIGAGGKRIRPAIALCAAAAVSGTVSDAVVQAAVAVELLHVGTLYHDDVIDTAPFRRGVPSANARWGNVMAAMAGNVLLSRASRIAMSLGGDTVGLIALTLARLCDGELEQMRYSYDAGRTVASYLSAIGGKTASLMAAAARMGALAAGGPVELAGALASYGQEFGMAFQVCDDIKDIVSATHELGKPAGHDMVEGTYTLPVIYALEDPVAGPPLRELLVAPLDDEQREQAAALVTGSDGVERATADAQARVARALDALEVAAALGARPAALDALAAVAGSLLAG